MIRRFNIVFRLRVHSPGRAGFNLIAVWAQAHSNRQLAYVGQVFLAIEQYADFIAETDTLVMGDLNSNQIWDRTPRVGNHSDVVARLAAHGLVSVYHDHYHEPQGAETRPTYYQYRHESMPYHLDYCFAPTGWATRLTSLTVGSYAEWSKLSDHCPIFAEFDLDGETLTHSLTGGKCRAAGRHVGLPRRMTRADIPTDLGRGRPRNCVASEL